MDSKIRALAVIALLLAVLIWGLTFSIVKNTISNYPIFPFLAMRFSIATIVLLPFAILDYRKFTKEINISITKRKGFYAGVILFCAYTLQTYGLRFTSAPSAAFLTNLYLFFVPFLILISCHTDVQKRDWLAALIALCGVYSLTKLDQTTEWKGNILIILCSFFYAIQILIVASKENKNSLIVFTTVQLFVVCILFWVVTLIQNKLFYMDFIPTIALESAIFTGIVSTSICYIIKTWSQQYLKPTQVTILLTLEPVFATASSNIFHKEEVSNYFIFGGTLIITAVILSQLPLKSKQKSL